MTHSWQKAIFRHAPEAGKVEKIRYGYYQWQDDDAFSEASLVTILFPEGIMCMETALLYYDYTDRTPDEWHMRSLSKVYPCIRQVSAAEGTDS